MLSETEKSKTSSLPLNKRNTDKMAFKERNVGLDAQSSLMGQAAVRPSGPGRTEAVEMAKEERINKQVRGSLNADSWVQRRNV